jgi:hypothetical protein
MYIVELKPEEYMPSFLKIHWITMVEKPEYTVLEKLGEAEIRRYPPLILATATAGSPFRLLFNYISGANRGSNKISMTAPVITPEKIAMTSPVISGGSSMSFVVPSKYTRETVPEPTDERVKIEEVPERILAVIQFRGRVQNKDIEKHINTLLSALVEHEMKTVGEPFLMRYNPPYTPGILRRNEVAVQVEYN